MEYVVMESRRGKHAKTASPIFDPEFREEFKAYVRQSSCEKGTKINAFNPIKNGGGTDLPPQPLILISLKILPYKHTLRFIDFSCMSITVLMQKTRAS